MSGHTFPFKSQFGFGSQTLNPWIAKKNIKKIRNKNKKVLNIEKN